MKKYWLLIALATFNVVAANEPFVVNSQLDPVAVAAEEKLSEGGLGIPDKEIQDIKRTIEKEEEVSKLFKNEDTFPADVVVMPPLYQVIQRDMDEADKKGLLEDPLGEEPQPPSKAHNAAGTAEKPKDIVPFIGRLLSDIFNAFFQPVKSFFSPESKDKNSKESIFSFPRVHDLPDNYQNSTSQVHQVGEQKVQVNQTIHKKSEDGRNNVYVYKVFKVLPNQKLVEETPQEEENDLRRLEAVLPAEIDMTENEIPRADPNELKAMKEYVIRKRSLRRKERSVEPDLPGNREIKFPSNLVPLYHRSYDRQNKQKPEKSPTSKSFVYKDIGGQKTFYIINHKSDIKAAAPGRNPESEVIGPLRKPDLSRDTLVNPGGGVGEHQGLIQVDPDSELFDLNLLIKEIESRPKKNQL